MSSSAKPSVAQGVLARRATRVLDPTFPPADGLVGPLLRKTPCQEQLFCALADNHVWAAMLPVRCAPVGSDRSIGP